ncbi:MAG: hypothetical protein J4415_00235 [Candidatus Diapherotrites archaeon]|uniref:Nucleoside phosphorylase domain-containing protein n=1 Tax=Candidatus Iainarchaeum sp. TaxID=3101447 RepID=A0A8T4KPK2_9ARCH|nr:hypothetical protein [Candidatus Diapherotrites archaeon]
MVYGDMHKDKKLLDVLCLEDIGLKSDDVPKTVVCSPYGFDREFGKGVLQRTLKKNKFQIKKVINYFSQSGAKGTSFLAKRNRQNILFLISGVGAVHASHICILLGKCKPVKNVIFVGSAAVLSDEISQDDINIPFESVRADRVAEEAIPLSFKALADKRLAKEFEPFILPELAKINSKLHHGKNYTICVAYYETKKFLERLKKQNIYTIELEASIFYTFLRKAKKRCIAIIRAGDKPLAGSYWGEKRRKKAKVKRAILNSIVNYLVSKTQ